MPDYTVTATPALEAQVRQRGLPWQQVVTIIAELHSRYVAGDPTWTMKQTGQRLGYSDGSLISRYLIVWVERGNADIWGAKSHIAALRVLTARREEAAAKAKKLWLGRANFGRRPSRSTTTQH